MSKQTEALKLALEALRDYRRSDDDRVSVAMGILQEALASEANEQCVCGEPNTPGTHRTDGPCLAEQPAQQTEPCGWRWKYNGGWAYSFAEDAWDFIYAVSPAARKAARDNAPASKPWVGLTDEEVKYQWVIWRASVPRYVGFAKGIEAKLREKNA